MKMFHRKNSFKPCVFPNGSISGWLIMLMALLSVYSNSLEAQTDIEIEIIQPQGNEVVGCQNNVFTIDIINNNPTEACEFEIQLAILLGTASLEDFEFVPVGNAWEQNNPTGPASFTSDGNEITINPGTLNAGASVSLQYSLNFNCSDIISIREITTGTVLLHQEIDVEEVSPCSFSINNQSGPHTLESELNLPWLSQVGYEHPTVILVGDLSPGQTTQFSVNLQNTGGGDFGGVLILSLPPFVCTESSISVTGINIAIVGETPIVINDQASLTSLLSEEGLQVDLSDYLRIIEQETFTVTFHFLRAPTCGIGVCETNLSVGWACNADDICPPLPLFLPDILFKIWLGEINNANLRLTRISPDGDNPWEAHCHGGELLWEFVLQNTGSTDIARNILIKLYNEDIPDALTAVPASSIAIGYQTTLSPPYLTTTYEPTWSVDQLNNPPQYVDVSENSDLQQCLDALPDLPGGGNDQFIRFYALKINELPPGKEIFFRFKTVRCCATTNVNLVNAISNEEVTTGENTGVIYNRWQLTAIGEDACNRPILVNDHSGFGHRVWTRNVFHFIYDDRYITLHMKEDFQVNGKDNPSLPDLMLKQTMKQNVYDLLGGTESGGCGTPELFKIKNQKFSKGYDAQLFTTSPNGTPEGQFKVDFDFDGANLRLDNAVIYEPASGRTWTGTVTQNPGSALFNISTFFTLYPNNNPSISNIDYFHSFFTNSEIKFWLKACCPNPDDIQPTVKVTTFFNPKMAALGCSDCFIPLSLVKFKVSVLCPGCVTPGIQINSFSFTRETLGFEDSNDDRLPERSSDPLQPLKPIINSSYPHWDDIERSGSIAGDVLLATIDAHFQDGDGTNVTGFSYGQWQGHQYGELEFLYLEQRIENADEVGLQCISFELKYQPQGAGPFTIYNYPGPLPMMSSNDIFLFRFHDDDIDGNAQFHVNDVFLISAKYQACNNPGETVELIIDNKMYLSTSSYSGESSPNTAFETIGKIMKDHLNYPSVPPLDAVNPANTDAENALWWCVARGGIHRIYHVEKEYVENWTPGSNQCRRSASIQIRHRVMDGDQDNLFPFEYRSVAGIDLNPPLYGPLLVSGSPLKFYLEKPLRHFNVSVGGTYTTAPFGSGNNQLQSVVYASEGNFINMAPGEPDLYTINTSNTIYSPPFDDLVNISSPNAPVYSGAYRVLLLGDEDFNQILEFSLESICINTFTTENAQHSTVPISDENAYAIVPEALVNPCGTTSSDMVLDDANEPDPASIGLSCMNAFIWPYFPVITGNRISYRVDIRSNGELRYNYYYLDKSRLPEGVRVEIYSQGVLIQPHSSPSVWQGFEQYNLLGGERVTYVDFIIENCEGAHEHFEHLNLLYHAWSCQELETDEIPYYNVCAACGQPWSPQLVNLYPPLRIPDASLEVVEADDPNPYECNTPLEIQTCLVNAYSGGVGNITATIELPEGVSLASANVTVSRTDIYGVPQSNQTVVATQPNSSDPTLWAINLICQTAFQPPSGCSSSSSMVGNDGFTNVDGTICLTFLIKPDCEFSGNITIQMSVSSLKYCNIIEGLYDELNYSIGPIQPFSQLPCKPMVEIDVDACGHSATASVLEGTGSNPFDFSWDTDPVQTTATITELEYGEEYSVIVTDDKGCTDDASVTIICNDNSLCTTDGCDNDECAYTPIVCDDNDACTANSCNSVSGCVYTSITCDDNNVCTDNSCAPSTGCVFTDNTGSCNDNSTCTENDVCSGGNCSGTAITCEDNNPCTDNSCVPATGCVYTNNTSSCNDNSACTENDVCSVGTCSGTAITCEDNNPCTDNSCAPATGCVYTNNTSSCNDNSACTENDVCSDGTCAGTTITCDDNDACTTNGCEPASGCVYPAITCDDNDVCTFNSCSPASGCVYPPEQIYYSFNLSHVTCFGACDGSFSVTAISGTSSPFQFDITYPGANPPPPVHVLISPGQTFQLPPLPGNSGLCAGNYNVTQATDNLGCVVHPGGLIKIKQPALLTVSLAITNVTGCNGNTNWTVSASNVSGGTLPYTYSWSGPGGPINVPSSQDVVAVPTEGNCCVTVTDAHGCTATHCIDLIDPGAITATLTVTEEISCHGSPDGSIQAMNTSGGIPPYTYSWAGPSGPINVPSWYNEIVGLEAGNYCVTITGPQGCSFTGCLNLPDPPVLDATVTGDNNDCRVGNNGEASVSVTGGTPPYSYTWYGPGIGNGYPYVLPWGGIPCHTDGNPIGTANNITGLQGGYEYQNGSPPPAFLHTGYYTVVVSDAKGCLFTTCVGINDESCDDGFACTTDVCDSAGVCTLTPIECDDDDLCTTDYCENGTCHYIPTQLQFQTTVTQAACMVNNGEIDLTVTGGTQPYSYQWSNGATSEDINTLYSGTYLLTVTDAYGCSATSGYWVSDNCCPPFGSFCDEVDYLYNNGAPLKYMNIQASGPNCNPEVARVFDDGVVILEAGSEVIMYPGFWAHPEQESGLFWARTAFPCTTAASPKAETFESEERDFNRVSNKFSIYPNPFSNSFTVEFSIPQSEGITLFLTDIAGKMIKTITDNQRFDEGTHKLNIKTDLMGAGIYFCTMRKQSGSLETKKLVKAVE